MTPAAPAVPAPGARVLIRDAEWVVRRADHAPDGGYRLVCDGISELVREREAVFLTTLEQPDLRVLDPAETRLVPDPSPGFADSRLWMESQLRQAVPSDERIHVGHRAAMDLVPYQLDPARQALRQPRQRILIADAVGLGKTLEAGVLVSELIARGRGRRILVLAVKSMLTQFQKEFWNRFTIPLTRLDSIGIQRVRSRIPTSHNPFHYYDKAIISIDTLKQDAEYRTYLEQAYWDVIVIDEAHNVADRGTGSLRSRLARLLARRSDALVMLSATPHDGRARSFASLMNMLDATAIADPDDFSPEDFRDKGLVIRRFKKDVQAQVRETFRDREIVRRRFPASGKEEAAYEALLVVEVAGMGAGAVASAGAGESAPTSAAGAGTAATAGTEAAPATKAAPATSAGAETGGTVRSAGAADDEAAPSRTGGGFTPSATEDPSGNPGASNPGADRSGHRSPSVLPAGALSPCPAEVAPGSPPPRRRDLFLVTLEKALFSSPAACIASIDQRIRRRERELARAPAGSLAMAVPPNEPAIAPNPPLAEEIESLRVLRAALERIGPDDYGKYRALLRAIRGGEPFTWSPRDARDRLVVFTERIETLHWLRDRLREDLDLGRGQLAILYGGMSDVDQQRVVEDFGNAARPVRLLLCSDVASEGINLHYHCHRLIHFDMPWSLMVFQQRNGRVDRYGQERTPRIVYLVTESANETIRGDTRILEVLERKDEQAYRDIGDPSAFMNVHDVEAEEDVTRRAIAGGEGAERFDALLAPTSNEGEDLLALFLGTAGGGDAGNGEDGRGGAGGGTGQTAGVEWTAGTAGTAGTAAAEPTAAGTGTAGAGNAAPAAPSPPPSLFASDLAYCEAALHRLREKDRGLRFETDAGGTTLTLDAPEDLRRRFGWFPREVVPEHWRFVLTSDPRRMSEAIAESRRDEAAWPRAHYLWRLNPVVGWLNDRMSAAFGRHEAPVLAGVPGLAPDEAVFVLSGLVPNRRSHPLVYEWIGVAYRGGRFEALVSFDDLLARTGLGRGPVANRGPAANGGQPPTDLDGIQRRLPEAVAKAREWVIGRRNAFEKRINDKLDRAVAALDELKARRLRQLELQLAGSGQAEAFKRARAERSRHEVEEIFDEYLEWIQETMTTEPRPWIKVVCAMTGGEGIGEGSDLIEIHDTDHS